MDDYAVGLDQNAAPAPGPFVVGRTTRMNYRVVDKSNAGAPVGVDLTLARWKVRVRAYVPGATSTTRDEECTVSPDAAAAADGWFDHAFLNGPTAYPSALIWEFVLVDNTKDDTSSKTGKREDVLLQWRKPISAAPRT